MCILLLLLHPDLHLLTSKIQIFPTVGNISVRKNSSTGNKNPNLWGNSGQRGYLKETKVEGTIIAKQFQERWKENYATMNSFGQIHDFLDFNAFLVFCVWKIDRPFTFTMHPTWIYIWRHKLTQQQEELWVLHRIMWGTKESNLWKGIWITSWQHYPNEGYLGDPVDQIRGQQLKTEPERIPA